MTLFDLHEMSLDDALFTLYVAFGLAVWTLDRSFISPSARHL